MERRRFLGLAALSGAASVLPHWQAKAATSVREFRILRDGSDIGRHRLQATREGEEFSIAIDIEIRVRILGITAYRYELQNRERWTGQRLLGLVSTTNDDGTDNFVRVRRVEGGLEVDGSGHSGLVPASAVASSYYVTDFMDRRPWLSSQSGEPLTVETVRSARGDGARWDVSGEVNTALFYNASGEWIGCEFDAGGEPAEYELIEDTGPIAPLWAGA